MPGSVAISIGNFDGVHRGHQALVAAARAAAGDDGEVVILSFDPAPILVLRPEVQPARLTTFEQRAALLKEAGADRVEPLRPTPELLGLSPQAFIEQVVAAHRPAAIVEGPDFRFGRGRAGTVRTLADLGSAHGYETIVIEPVEVGLVGQQIVTASSSMVRWLVERGRVADAAALLGRPYELQGTVVPGDRRGRVIGVPTANLDHGDALLPADGVYAGVARRDDGGAWPAAISVGVKPTFTAAPRLCEAHLVGFDGPLDDYGWTMHLQCTRWLRGQIAFDGPDALQQQLRRDVARAASWVDGAVA
jgi:riboflavin kinase/FMN adenylyltransferase